MGWMATALNFICRLAGYSSCGALSTFEAIILAAIPPLLRPPLPRRQTIVSMHTESIGSGPSLLVDIVPAVPNKRPGHPLAHHDGAEILA